MRIFVARVLLLSTDHMPAELSLENLEYHREEETQ